MKSHLMQLVNNISSSQRKMGLIREYLQAIVLQSLQNSGAMGSIAFHGGTSLRFLYQLPRFSEDLDFTLEFNQTDFDFPLLVNKIERDLANQGYVVTSICREDRIVQSALIKFPGLLFEAKASDQPTKILMIKLEIDTNPPDGARTTTSVIRNHVILNLHHHDQSSLFAGKIHAVLQRNYTKGRDLYDLLWYLSSPEWPQPNFPMLNSALAQSSWENEEISPANWKEILAKKLKGFDWERIQKDVGPFIENSQELKLLNYSVFSKLLE